MKDSEAAQQIIVALDTDATTALELAHTLQGKATWLKVGMTLFYSAGPAIVKELKDLGFRIFVDLKLHDIPHQVEGAAEAVTLAGADMLTVHASGGIEMMQAALRGAERGATAPQKPICLAITVLTSIHDDTLQTIGVTTDAKTQVLRLAALAREAGMDGIVCSPQEASLVRAEQGSEFVLVTPGVRPAGSARGDQARVATPARALADGADFLVIGRPITEAAEPEAAFEAIVKEMS